ncbi:hypothetical protein QQS21_006757 [Conoideocrella luteorostrata]|uniref:DUF7924 domain-containing protein n=1 Tax=Conoideocrella luteorostrata TaxID=1105319 RepID=A0AAJ0FXP3_9HYPO|nr:hypothetical protein QQS21_006757 [Conoideocrella luteorostrata]
MLPQVDNSRPQGLFKGSRSHSFDGRDSEGPRSTKRHRQRPPTTRTLGRSHENVSPPSHPQAAPLTPPPESAKFEDDKSEGSRPRRKSCPYGPELKEDPDTVQRHWAFARRGSCPPRLGIRDSDTDKGQRPLLEVLQELSQAESQRRSLGAGSISSARGLRPPTSHADYRKTLYNNGVWIDHRGVKIPKELRTFLDSHILKERSLKLSAEAIAEVAETAVGMADGPESNVYDFAHTAMLPIKHRGVGRGGNTPSYPDGLPRNKMFTLPIAAPKPDIHLGYPITLSSDWTNEERAVIDHPVARRLTQPAKGNCFPFFSFELKSEAMGGNLWQAENQAAGSGACCVNSTCWLYREAHPSEVQPIVDSIAFSACASHRLVVFHVHFYLHEENRYYMSQIAAYDPLRQVQESNHLVESIIEHCLGERQTKIRKALALLYPFPDHWKNSRPASGVDSLYSAAGQDDTSNKSQRTV